MVYEEQFSIIVPVVLITFVIWTSLCLGVLIYSEIRVEYTAVHIIISTKRRRDVKILFPCIVICTIVLESIMIFNDVSVDPAKLHKTHRD